MRSVLRAAAIAFSLLTVPCFGLEVIHLSNGFDLTAKCHVDRGDQLILTTERGTISIAQSEVTSIEVLQDLQPPKELIQSPRPSQPENPTELLKRVASATGNSPEFIRLVRSVAMVESGLRQSAVSSKGAIGLMQLMPSTAKLLGVEAQDAEQNARGGSQLLARLLELYHYDSVRAIAAYNAGPGAVHKYGGLPPFVETQGYVRRVLLKYQQLTAAENATKSE
jgi:hypothetical protein